MLEIQQLVTCFDGPGGPVPVVDGLSLHVGSGEVLGLVGESGSGKSMTAFSVVGLLPAPGRVSAGDIRFDGRRILGLDPAEMRRLRGGEIALVWQEGQNALDPLLPCGEHVAEVLRQKKGLGRAQARREAIDLLRRVHLADPQRVARQYAHQLSGGMAQRVMLAMALAGGPRLLIADEVTAGLDLTIQAQVLELLEQLRVREGMAILLITHDLGVVASLAHRVAVMYAGRIVESGPTAALLGHPRHPYTRGLLRARPRLRGPRRSLRALPGSVSPPRPPQSSCPFQPRCDAAIPRCTREDPPPRPLAGGRELRCFVDLPDVAEQGSGERDRREGFPEPRLDS